MRGNIKMLGWFYIIWNALGLLGGLVALTVAGLLGGLFTGATYPHHFAVLPIFATFGMIVFLITAALSLPGLLVGWGLITFQPWARVGGIVLSALNLTVFPLGTMLGVFGLVTLCDAQAATAFDHP